MTSAIFPALPGLGWSVSRAPLWKTRVQEAVSGKETRIADWSYPRWQWELAYDFLRQGAVNGVAAEEMAALAGFFNARRGMFESFLYEDSDDHAAAGQGLGTGDGVTQSFPLVRAFGGFVEPILAPAAVSHVYRAGIDHGDWTVSGWDSASPGSVTFAAAPGAGEAITADFSFYFPVRFVEDAMSFENFMQALWRGKSVKLISVKN